MKHKRKSNSFFLLLWGSNRKTNALFNSWYENSQIFHSLLILYASSRRNGARDWSTFVIEITLISIFVHHMSKALLTTKTKTMKTESNSSYCDVESNTVCSPKIKNTISALRINQLMNAQRTIVEIQNRYR